MNSQIVIECRKIPLLLYRARDFHYSIKMSIWPVACWHLCFVQCFFWRSSANSEASLRIHFTNERLYVMKNFCETTIFLSLSAKKETFQHLLFADKVHHAIQYNTMVIIRDRIFFTIAFPSKELYGLCIALTLEKPARWCDVSWMNIVLNSKYKKIITNFTVRNFLRLLYVVGILFFCLVYRGWQKDEHVLFWVRLNRSHKKYAQIKWWTNSKRRHEHRKQWACTQKMFKR